MSLHYKHLGTIFASDHSLDAEIYQRIGLANAAFGQIAKPILCNRHLPEKVRTQLFQTSYRHQTFLWLRSMDYAFFQANG